MATIYKYFYWFNGSIGDMYLYRLNRKTKQSEYIRSLSDKWFPSGLDENDFKSITIFTEVTLSQGLHYLKGNYVP